ncbi:Non-hem dioxygenase N-terminal domain [Dillenia turbinata]|uniref:Non-hem dioxygenase N-terminal domain n=1 Tax=Dillenia turbinata TaxID=194707 RepID=A0AAN8ZC22_9MAGN
MHKRGKSNAICTLHTNHTKKYYRTCLHTPFHWFIYIIFAKTFCFALSTFLQVKSLSMMNSSDPPFYEIYKTLIEEGLGKAQKPIIDKPSIIQECELPMIDLSKLRLGGVEREECMEDIAKASREWGFFQVMNHGIPMEVLEEIRLEEVNVFQRPFVEKIGEKFLNLSPGSYRWGTPSATCIHQLSWSEALHISLEDISGSLTGTPLSSTVEQYSELVLKLAQKLAEILAEKLGYKSTFFQETCVPSSCYLRMNRYPPCPISPGLFGLMPHTDSDFLTILSQDEVGGLQLVKDGKWIAVKPNPQALVINIGDFFQAWSNGIYKSVEHRVVANEHAERFSTAFFVCPIKDAVIQICGEPPKYRPFSYQEYRRQVHKDVKNLGQKVGLARFLVGAT